MRIARRTLLKAGSGLVAFAAFSRVASALPAPRAGEAGLLRLVTNRSAATRLGRRYLEQHPETTSARELTRSLSTRLNAVGGIRRAALRRCLAADFAAGRITTLDGWILARTEAELCALAALKAGHGSSKVSLA